MMVSDEHDSDFCNAVPRDRSVVAKGDGRMGGFKEKAEAAFEIQGELTSSVVE
jgi:hypothetical protein